MMFRRIRLVVMAVAGLVACATNITALRAQDRAAVVELSAEPTVAQLQHRDDAVQLLVTAKRNDGRVDDVTARCSIYNRATRHCPSGVRPVGSQRQRIDEYQDLVCRSDFGRPVSLGHKG